MIYENVDIKETYIIKLISFVQNQSMTKNIRLKNTARPNTYIEIYRGFLSPIYSFYHSFLPHHTGKQILQYIYNHDELFVNIQYMDQKWRIERAWVRVAGVTNLEEKMNLQFFFLLLLLCLILADVNRLGRLVLVVVLVHLLPAV